MQIGNRFRCYPIKQQAEVLLQWIGAQRFTYNAKVSEDRYFRRFALKSLSHTGEYAPIDQTYSQFKTDELSPWMKQIPSQILRNGAVKWKQGYDRFFAKLAGRPTIHTKHGKQSVWLTSELFQFTKTETGYELQLGTKTKQLGVLAFKAHKPYQLPATIHISIHAGRWFVSFNYDDQQIEPKTEDTIAWLQQFSESELAQITVGIDRGVAIHLALSNGVCFGFSDVQKKRLVEQERKKKRWQKIQARRVQGSRNQKKAKYKVARYARYAGNVRQDMAHKASRIMVDMPDKKLFVFESLKLKNMTKKPKAKQDAQGHWLSNGAKAKAGLNKALLASALGITKIFTSYKAKRAGKLVIEVPTFYTSQECSQCGHIHPDNRVTQDTFICQSCGHSENADINAGKVIAKRGIHKLLSDKSLVKKKKQVKKLGKTKVGQEMSEPIQVTVSTLGESVLDAQGQCLSVLYSVNQETPTSTVG